MTPDKTPSEAELLPCPFCGEAAKHSFNSLYGDMSMASCKSCGATAYAPKWNRRAVLAKWGTPPAVGVEPVARLEIESLKAQLHAAKQINAAQFGLLAASIPGSALRASHGQAPAETGNSVSAQADSVLYDPKAVLDVFNSARAGSDKSSGYLRGILAVIAHWESRPEPHRWMVPVQAQAADSVQEDAARYRWLRDETEWEPFDSVWLIKNDIYGCPTLAMDVAIDAARKQGEKHDR